MNDRSNKKLFVRRLATIEIELRKAIKNSSARKTIGYEQVILASKKLFETYHHS